MHTYMYVTCIIACMHSCKSTVKVTMLGRKRSARMAAKYPRETASNIIMHVSLCIRMYAITC